MGLSYGTVLHCERRDARLGGWRKGGQGVACARSNDRKVQRGDLIWH